MTEQQVKEKIKNIVHNELLHEEIRPFGDGEYGKIASTIADALIAAGIGDVRDIQAESNRYEMLYKLQNRDMVLANRKVQEYNHRAEVAEKAARNLITYYCGYNIESDIDNSLRVALQQAERELAEEGKDD